MRLAHKTRLGTDLEMRRDFQMLSIERIAEVLQQLGYREEKAKSQREREFRHGKFHVILANRKGKAVMWIHVDTRSPLLVGHRARKSGKDINRELKRIEKALYSC